MRTFVRLLAVVIFALFSGCSDGPAPTGSGTHSSAYWPDDPDAQWRATYIRGLFHFEGNVTLSFDSTGDRIFGRSGCNEYFAELLHPTDDETTIGRFMGSAMACGGTLMDTEDVFLAANFKMHYLRISRDRLVIKDNMHRTLIVFAPTFNWRGHR